MTRENQGKPAVLQERIGPSSDPSSRLQMLPILLTGELKISHTTV
jgi:hypothetical protein